MAHSISGYPIKVRAPDVEVSDYTALLSGASWWGEGVTNRPAIVTYSFDIEGSDYLLYNDLGGAFRDSFEAFTTSERGNAVAALNAWSAASGIIFLEAPAGEGDIKFGKYDITNLDQHSVAPAAFAYYPVEVLDRSGSFSDPIGGDVFVNVQNSNVLNEDDATFHYLVHEIGHALGLKHPFEGDPTLIASLDDTSQTVMSYTGAESVKLGLLDLDAIRALYGSNAQDGQQVGHWAYGDGVLHQDGTSAADTIRGVTGADDIDGGDGDDLISSGQGNDTVQGGKGNDAIFTGDGADEVFDGAGSSTVDAGAGDDRIDLTGSAEGSTVWAGTGNDVVRGGSSGDALNGEYGNDTIEAGSGNDVVSLWLGDDVASGGAGDDRVDGAAGRDQIAGDSGNDTLIGGGGADRLDGGAGNDWMQGDHPLTRIGFGSGYFYMSEIDGTAILPTTSIGTALDITKSFILSSYAWVEDSATVPHVQVAGSGNGHAIYLKLDVVEGEIVRIDVDSIERPGGWIGNEYFDSYVRILGEDGRLIAANDDAPVDVGSENKTDSALSYEATRTETIYISLGTFDQPDYIIPKSFYSLIVSVDQNAPAADTLLGGDGNDTLDGGIGADRMAGGAGNDLYVVDSAGDRLEEVTGGGADTVEASIDFTLGSAIDHLRLVGTANLKGTGNELANQITGNLGANRLFGLTGNDVLSGLSGNDVLDGGVGADRMSGGAGDDLYYFDVLGDVAVEGENEGRDAVYASTHATLGANLEVLRLQGTGDLKGDGNALANEISGTAGANRLRGFGGNDSLVGLGGDDSLEGGEGRDNLGGGDGNDILDGGLDGDWMVGDKGDDLFVVDNVGDHTNERAGEGIDMVYATSNATLGDNVENLRLQGTGDLKGDGNALSNAITGTSGANRLRGFGGNDNLGGLDGADTLDGGAGADTMAGGRGDDLYYVDAAGDVVWETGGNGMDMVYASASFTLGAHVENLRLQGGADLDGAGNDLGNLISGTAGRNILRGQGGDDTLAGFDGDDLLVGSAGRDTLAGGGGADTLDGAQGADVLDVGNDAAADIVRFRSTDSAGTGWDEVSFLHLNGEDRIDLGMLPTSIGETVSGTLSRASLGADLASALGVGQLGQRQALIFDPDGGDLDRPGHVFLVVDLNGIAGYQGGSDFVADLGYGSGSLSLDDFV